jgi:tetratricopeptide (TPR) repeat protein
MLRSVEQQLEEANKLIFVKRYADADQVLASLVASEDGQDEALIHFRRIELATMLKSLDKLRQQYTQQLSKTANLALIETCIVLTQQQGDMLPPSEAAAQFQELIRTHGASAAAHYGIGYAMEQLGSYERAIFNYQQALNIDPNWVVAYFGLSQVNYQLGDDKKGDHFFYLFERAAPYNVYGNFETHRQLCQDFLQRERFLDAEVAIQTLSTWWIENKGSCPLEIQVYELFATARISESQGDRVQASDRRERAHALADSALVDDKVAEHVLYFIAKVLEDFDSLSRACVFYEKILKRKNAGSQVIQKIGSQFLALGEFEIAKELFTAAYQVHPEHSDVRFCLLVSHLKLAGVNVEEYLIGRERLRQLISGNGDKVELLALLHSLIAKFAGDSDVQGHIADVYLKLGNIERAGKHFDKMYQIDHLNRSTALKYANFVLHYREADQANSILDRISADATLPSDDRAEIYWLKASFYARKKDFAESQNILRKVLRMDPWNVSYLVQEIINLMNLATLEAEQKKIDPVLTAITSGDDSPLSWQEFDQKTDRIEAHHAYELAYARRKLRYLYANGTDDTLQDLVRSACRQDAATATYEFIKLLNTNFDSYSICWALGTLYKELWQLETAGVWFEQMLMYSTIPAGAKSRAYLELADCFIWQNKSFDKAVEYAKLSIDLAEKQESRSNRTLAHAYLKIGQIRHAKAVLDHMDADSDPETRYLQGLLLYRNGSREQANHVWKPLLTLRSESLRFHNIKQDILRYYFEGAPYLKVN